MKEVLLLNGPNLNTLGRREPEIYGSESLEDIENRVRALGERLGFAVEAFQSNHEGALIDRIQDAADDGVAGVVINPGGLTHTSVALRDALASISAPFVEVHISNVYAREAFRHRSYLSGLASGVIVGCGTLGYELALRRLAELIGVD